MTNYSRVSLMLVFVCGVSMSAVAAATPETAAKKDEDRIVCKRQAPTGTRFAKKTCRSKKELDAIAESAKRTAREMIDRPSSPRCAPSCS